MDIENIEQNIKIGQEILNQLHAMSDKEIMEWLKELLPNVSMLDNKPVCERLIRNEKVHSITVSVWDVVEIGCLGISFKPEHGYPKRVVEFNKHFKV